MAAKITVRHGHCVFHVNDAAAAAQLAARLSQESSTPAVSAPAVAREASHILVLAAEMVTLLGGVTLSAGLQRLRSGGRQLPGRLARDLRSLDGAAALLRQPGSPRAVLQRLEAWLVADASLGSCAESDQVRLSSGQSVETQQDSADDLVAQVTASGSSADGGASGDRVIRTPAATSAAFLTGKVGSVTVRDRIAELEHFLHRYAAFRRGCK